MPVISDVLNAMHGSDAVITILAGVCQVDRYFPLPYHSHAKVETTVVKNTRGQLTNCELGHAFQRGLFFQRSIFLLWGGTPEGEVAQLCLYNMFIVRANYHGCQKTCKLLKFFW